MKRNCKYNMQDMYNCNDTARNNLYSKMYCLSHSINLIMEMELSFDWIAKQLML